MVCSRFDAWLDEASKQLEQVVKIEGDEHVHIVNHPNQVTTFYNNYQIEFGNMNEWSILKKVPSVEERQYECDDEDKVPQLVDGNEEEVNDEEEKKEKRIRNKKRSNQTVG